jgi:hypothetical protein
VTDRCQDGRLRHVQNLSACYKMSNYHPILMKLGTQTNNNLLSSKITKGEVYGHFQEDCRRHVGNSSECYKMGNYQSISMDSRTQTKKNMLS